MTTSPPLPWASHPALNHPPTRRAIRRRLWRQALLIFGVWPALIVIPIVRAATGDARFIPVVGLVLFALAPVLLPLNIWIAVSALRMHRVLSASPWRLVRCVVVPATERIRQYIDLAESQGRDTQVLAVLQINDAVLTSAPFRRYVSNRLTHVWCAGNPGHGGVAALPGGERPFRLVRYKLPIPEPHVTPRALS